MALESLGNPHDFTVPLLRAGRFENGYGIYQAQDASGRLHPDGSVSRSLLADLDDLIDRAPPPTSPLPIHHSFVAAPRRGVLGAS